MRTILLNKGDEEYLKKCAVELGFTFGVVCGQRAESEKYVAVLLAKNSEVEEDYTAQPQPQHVEDIDTQALTNQWISATKMMPGSFMVLGVFISGVEADLINENSYKEAKKLLYDVHNLLVQCNNYIATVDNVDDTEYLFLTYSTAAKKAVCKYYSITANGGTFTDMECRFAEKAFEWYTFECNYEQDDVYPILEHEAKVNIERQFQRSILTVKKCLNISEIFVNNETVEDNISLEKYVANRAKPSKSSRVRMLPNESFKVSIYLPVRCQIGKNHAVQVRQFNGTVRFSGVISSRIWCNPKNSIGDMKRFVRNDILRSLAARIQVYCDGITEPHLSNEAIYISEPPRRVYFSVPNHGPVVSVIQFSEYIFRGEAPTVAVAQAKQVLDLDINTEDIVADVESLPDDETFSELSSENSLLIPNPMSPRDMNRTMYTLGVAVALLALLVSILLTYLLRQ